MGHDRLLASDKKINRKDAKSAKSNAD